MIQPNSSEQHIYFGEQGYLQLLADTLEHGCDVPDRTGVGRRRLFDQTLRYDLRDSFPAFTIRNTPPKFAIEEFWAFLNAIVHINDHLSAKGIKFWEGNTTREFLDNRGLNSLPVGHFGKSYGFQIRHYGGKLDPKSHLPYGGIDQLTQIYNTLSSDPFGSRALINMWNPSQEKEMALPPCWYGHQFLVTKDKKGNPLLNLGVNSRSADLVFGTPYNVQQYATYLQSMAESLNMIPAGLSCRLLDPHIYGKESDFTCADSELNPASQFRYVKETLTRSFSKERVELEINKPLNSLEDILSLDASNFKFKGYKPNLDPYLTPHPKMAV